MRCREMICLMDSGTCATNFEKPWLVHIQTRKIMCIYGNPSIRKCCQGFVHIFQFSHFNVKNLLTHALLAISYIACPRSKSCETGTQISSYDPSIWILWLRMRLQAFTVVWTPGSQPWMKLKTYLCFSRFT